MIKRPWWLRLEGAPPGWKDPPPQRCGIGPRRTDWVPRLWNDAQQEVIGQDGTEYTVVVHRRGMPMLLGNAAPFQAVIGAIAHYVERARGRGYQVEVSRNWRKKEAPLISGPRPTVVVGPFATYNQATAEADAIIAALRAGTYPDAP